MAKTDLDSILPMLHVALGTTTSFYLLRYTDMPLFIALSVVILTLAVVRAEKRANKLATAPDVTPNAT
ncbi:hypothetical protein [Streptomyces zaomyceticus]|uniref:hypothetical protein n=1 Tax=Streptomyces zaomyceticus TaxID=68286 RepID=UPI00379B4501